jgi:hypothetical protein
MLKRYRVLIALGIAIIGACNVLFCLQTFTLPLVSINNQPVTPMPVFNFGGSADYVEELAHQAIVTENTTFIADVCREGVIYGYAAFVLSTCERAVELEPRNAYYHDYRGVALLMMEDFAGALSDFQVYVAYLRQNNLYDSQYGAQRDRWIGDMQTGHDPLADCRQPETPQFLYCDGLFRNIIVTP